MMTSIANIVNIANQNRKLNIIHHCDNNIYHFKKKSYLKNKSLIEEPEKPYADFQQLKTAKVKQGSSTAKKSPIPFIQLQEKWLEKAGFKKEAICLVEVYKGMLVITLDECANKNELANKIAD